MKALLTKHRKLLGDITIAVLLCLITFFDLFSYLEYKLQDSAYQKLTGIDPEIVVIGIDEAALARFGRFGQWSRQIMADAINILNSDEDYKPAVIAIDIVYDVESSDKEADAALVLAAKRGGNVVMSSLANFGQEIHGMRLRKAIKEHETPYPALAEVVGYGMANCIYDSDSLIRSAPLKAPFNGETLYSFPVEILKQYTGLPPNDFIDSHNEVFITYYDLPGAYKQLSFADIFEEDFDPSYFADCIVLIGPYATGMMDAYYTPISLAEQMYGVEINANVVQMLLHSNFKQRAPVEATYGLTLLFIVAAMLLARFTDIRVLLAILAAVGAGYFFFCQYLFGRGVILTLIYPLFALLAVYIYQLIYGYILEALEKRKVRDAFKKYVDPKLVDKLMESGEANSNEVGVEKNIAVLFVDVRGFTSMSEALKDQPDMVVKVLNEYLELTANAVFNNGGSVDKFIGDATMALFNGFVALDDYVFRAVKAAWDIVQGAAEVNASIKEKYGVDVGFGVGVNCGKAIVGNLGPSFRKDYTAIGDTVNTAARLESNAARSQILISKNVYDIVKGRVTAKSIGEIPLKGKSIKLEVFSVTGIL